MILNLCIHHPPRGEKVWTQTSVNSLGTDEVRFYNSQVYRVIPFSGMVMSLHAVTSRVPNSKHDLPSLQRARAVFRVNS